MSLAPKSATMPIAMGVAYVRGSLTDRSLMDKFDPAIYNSPRFGWVPVFAQETASGGSAARTAA